MSVTVTVYARHKPGYVWNDKDGDMATDGDENLNEPGYYYPPAARLRHHQRLPRPLLL